MTNWCVLGDSAVKPDAHCSIAGEARQPRRHGTVLPNLL